MHTASILLALILIWARREWAVNKETVVPTPIGEPRPTPTPPPWGVGA